MLTDAEAEKQREELGMLGPSPIGLDGTSSDRVDRPDTATSTEPEHDHDNDTAPSEKSISMAGSPDSKRHIRRSLQKTLRDSTRRGSSKDMQHHHSHSGKKSGKNDSVSSTALPENAIADGDDTSAEGLKRNDGSFTVHGKKASVITFGGDWASMDAGERLKTLARNESQKDASTHSHSAATPPHSSIMSIKEGKRASERGFMLAPRRSSVSLKERRAISQNFAGAHGSGEEIGTARSLRKFSSSSGPPNFGEDLKKVREEAARRNGNAKEEKTESSSEEEEEEETSSEEEEGMDDVTPRPIKTKPLDASPITGPSSLKT